MTVDPGVIDTLRPRARRPPLVLVVAALVLVAPRLGRADALRCPDGFLFTLPESGALWEQERAVELTVLNDAGAAVPELVLFCFTAGPAGSLDELLGRLPTEIVRPGVLDLGGDPLTGLVAKGDAKPAKIEDAAVRTLAGTLASGDEVKLALVERGGQRAVLVGLLRAAPNQRPAGVHDFTNKRKQEAFR